jgi:hypothetical protein
MKYQVSYSLMSDGSKLALQRLCESSRRPGLHYEMQRNVTWPRVTELGHGADTCDCATCLAGNDGLAGFPGDTDIGGCKPRQKRSSRPLI